jgi:hypothetical protein
VDVVVPVVEWRKSRRCEATHCVEVSRIGDAVALRNSVHPDGTVLTFGPEAWSGFVAGVRAGDFETR